MTRRARATLGILGLAAMGLAFGVAGCGSDGNLSPVPQPVATADDPWARVLPTAGTGPAAQGLFDGGGWGGAGQPHIDINTSDSLTVYSISTQINGAYGGVIPFGRYVLTFLPGAFNGTQTIRVESDSDGFVDCRLYPEGLQFNRAVLLSMSLMHTTQDCSRTTIFWYDAEVDGWVDMEGWYNPFNHTVTAKLRHFSEYRAGRAGW